MDEKTFDELNTIHENCANHDKCTNCEYFLYSSRALGQACLLFFTMPDEWNMERFVKCKNCAEYHNGRCLHYKHEVKTTDSCSFFYFKKDGD